MDTNYGLLVPVIRDVDKKSINEISIELLNLQRKPGQRKLTLEEDARGDFYSSNLGGLAELVLPDCETHRKLLF